MRKIITSLIAILVVTNLEAQQRTPKLVVCITVDQLRGDYIEYFYNTFGERGFKRLMNEGLVYNPLRVLGHRPSQRVRDSFYRKQPLLQRYRGGEDV